MPRTYRTSLKLTQEAKEAVEELARKRGASVSSTLEDLVGTGLTVESFREVGGEVYGRIPDGTREGRRVLIASDGTVFRTVPSKLRSVSRRLRRER